MTCPRAGSNPVDALTTNLGLPREVVQKLPRGGQHFLFRVDLSLRGAVFRPSAGRPDTSVSRHVDRANDIGDWHLPTFIRLTILGIAAPQHE